MTLHGDRRVDDWFWMRDRTDPRVMAYLEAENAYTDAVMAHTKPLEDELYTEMLGRIKEDDDSPPVRRGEYWYYSRTEKGKAYPIYARKHGALDASEEIILDQNAEAEGKAFYQLGALAVSPDHRRLAILEDTNGYEDFVLRVKELDTGRWNDDSIAPLGFGLAWASDSATLFYTTTDAAKRSDSVWRHVLGDPRQQDVRVFHDPDPLFNVGVERDRSGRYVIITAGSFTQSEAWLVDAAVPASAPVVVRPRASEVEYEVCAGADRLFITTNLGGATNFAVYTAPFSAPSEWTPWQAHDAAVFVEGVLPLAEHIVVQQRMKGLRVLRVVELANADAHFVEFPEAAYGVDLGSNPEFAGHSMRFVYSSLITPPSTFDYDCRTRARVLVKQQEVPNYDPSQYAIERVEAVARDGTRVPISMVYKAPLVRDGSRPALLYAYGSYGATMEPTFSSARFSLVDRGFVYAIAHVRGGQEMGRPWYDDGKMMKKMNSFTDFIDAGRHLVAERITAPSRLAANGGSAGGLLMGAVVNLAPELWNAVVADVPFVDVINTMSDASIPLTAQEWEQWGNPAVEAEYRYMLRYSPYDNVAARAYPALLITSGVNDSRVAYWEPTKWTAKLRTLNIGTRPLLLKMNMGAGHGGRSRRYERIREQAFRYAFVIDQTPR
ncbi:MAG: S9 family peptidase [Gemmatimonadaceae bacterium]|nr:S9 family peptidase [Gemmatimonadaceae bacterium]